MTPLSDTDLTKATFVTAKKEMLQSLGTDFDQTGRYSFLITTPTTVIEMELIYGAKWEFKYSSTADESSKKYLVNLRTTEKIFHCVTVSNLNLSCKRLHNILQSF